MKPGYGTRRSYSRLGSSLAVLDLLQLGSALSLRGLARLGSSFTVTESARACIYYS